MDFLETLNREQRLATELASGPAAIIAGPGTGKTKTLTSHIAYLIQNKNVKPEKILALTFTNKAAKEMESRLSQLLPLQAHTPTITTFHGLCFQLLTASNPEMRIINEQERLILIRSLKKQLALKKIPLRELGLLLSRNKSLVGQDTQHEQDTAVTQLLDAYNESLQTQHLYDFDDLLQQTFVRLSTDTAYRVTTQKHFDYILVDEFQDTSDLQYQLVKLLNATDNLFVIGDPLQSIYGFRGGDAHVFDQFMTDFPAVSKIILSTNYRSVPEVVTLANALFPNAPQLRANQTKPGQLHATEVLNPYTEASFIINDIERRVGGTDFLTSHAVSSHAGTEAVQFSDFAILYRTHRIARQLRQALDESGIPYQIVGEGSPYDEPYIQAIICVLAYLANPDPVQYDRLIRTSALQKLSKSQIDHILSKLDATSKPSEIASSVVQLLNLAGDNPKENRFLQFMNTIRRFDEEGLNACSAYLDAIAEQAFYDKRAVSVSLMTIHAAKGLEFEHVYIIGCEDGILPHENNNDVEEEKRLFYVAATRARSSLHLLYVRTRGNEPARPSPFITSLSSDVLAMGIDPSLTEQVRRLQLRQHKRAQTSLF